MRAARLLHLLMILQNRGRQTCRTLASTLEVSHRTILRDIDALTEAGLPVITHRGAQGGVELGFDYRTRLTGLAEDEAEAMALLLALIPTEVHHLGLADAARRAQAKLAQAFPDITRQQMARVGRLFPISPSPVPPDPRRAALAQAVKRQVIVQLQVGDATPVTVHPVALHLNTSGWVLEDARGPLWPESAWGDIVVSARPVPASEPILPVPHPKGTTGR
jgi:predicted DNA-binding transcriptional regulator YafY